MSALEFLSPQNLMEYEDFVTHHPQGTFMQSYRWAKVKSNWICSIIVSRDKEDQRIVGSMMVLVKKAPVFGASILYAPRGPLCPPDAPEVLEDLMAGVQMVAKKYNGFLLKIDPYVEETDEAFISLCTNLGFRYQPDQKDLTTVQTRINYMLDIAGKTPEEVFAGFHSKCRYNIRVALRHGVQCLVQDKSHLPEFYKLYQITAERDGFTPRPLAYFERLLKSMQSAARLYLCYYEGEPVSGAIAVNYAGKTCYLYGASDNDHRNVMPNYLMQWEMIQWAIETGCHTYDFQGIPFYDDPESSYYGIYRFKKSFQGKVVKLVGDFDFILRPNLYRAFTFLSSTHRKMAQRMHTSKSTPS
ncbi:lipid II:glycine glycyltransferase FemX [Zongyangia hominis]|uniref:Peptidoglycan bridge formation glycyltransferase FemA/FemB family protein n=1 Tax=Zongyangia hominis TaxID=2763677 RepID=A0A926I6W7_9FIRM|nr:aminoacyltransferase [Zongyangia hominis]MBC8570479.1 peptidoglycan bridge formation glycyltransferase FemA/FemB family protein [Zongyangia hominis]